MPFPISSLTIVMAVLLVCLISLGDAAQVLKRPGEEPALNAMDAEVSLVTELSNGTVNQERLARFEAILRPTFDALPKTNGHLGHQAVRYTLHRFMVHQHSWYIRGLEPSDTGVPPPYLHSDWVPAYLQGLLEERFGDRGINLPELAALAASLEDLVRMEASSKLEGVYNLHEIPTSDVLNNEEVDDILSTYMMMYLREGNLSFLKPSEVHDEKLWFAGKYTDWPLVIEWVTEIKEHHVSLLDNPNRVEFKTVAKMAGEINERFGAFNDKECRSLKTAMMDIEDKRKPGRVRLSAFYKKGLYSHWRFNEKVGYLRRTGTLDESDPKQARVILPNYLASRTNCLDASSLYAVCCRNECEELMGHLETAIAAPDAEPSRVWDLVAKLPSDTVIAPRNLSGSLLKRLGEISSNHGGKVPIHGRLFAQWMHHAFPRECPYPHETGVATPQTPDEWMKETGEEDSRTSEEEMLWHVGNDTCAVTGCGGHAEEDGLELPWSSVEELLVSKPLVSYLPNLYHGWAAKHHARSCGDSSVSDYEFGCCMFGCPGSAEDAVAQSKDPVELLETRLLMLERGASFLPAVLFLIFAAFMTYQRSGQARRAPSGRGHSEMSPDSKTKGLPIFSVSAQENDPRMILLVCSAVLTFNAAGLLHRGVFVLTLCGGLIFYVVLPSTVRWQAMRAVVGPKHNPYKKV